jgi:hypothetical protein
VPTPDVSHANGKSGRHKKSDEPEQQPES